MDYLSFLKRDISDKIEMMKEVKAKIIGRVQGVFFRDFTKRVADSLGVVGFVSNLWNGSVETLAQADEETLKEFISKIKQGPRHAEVEDVDVEWKDELTEEYDRFSIAG